MPVRCLPVFSLLSYSAKTKNPGIHTIHREISSLCCIWYARGLLSEKCKYPAGQPWSAGGDLHPCYWRTAHLEKADAFIHRGRHDLLYAVDSFCILNLFCTFNTTDHIFNIRINTYRLIPDLNRHKGLPFIDACIKRMSPLACILPESIFYNIGRIVANP